MKLRSFTSSDAAMVQDLATDPYVPLVTSITANSTAAEAHAYIDRQNGRLAEGAGFSFCIADRGSDVALGQVGLWLRDLAAGRATAGYLIAPSAQGQGCAGQAMDALTTFAWSIDGLYRVELYIEPGNFASIRTAVTAGYQQEGLLRSHQEIGGRRKDMLIFAAIRPSD